MLRPDSGRERALFGRNRGKEGTCKARRHTHLGPETASGSGDYVAASTAIGARAVQRLHRDRGLTLQAGAAAQAAKGSRTASSRTARAGRRGSLEALTRSAISTFEDEPGRRPAASPLNVAASEILKIDCQIASIQTLIIVP
jgi:hypothetical protein